MAITKLGFNPRALRCSGPWASALRRPRLRRRGQTRTRRPGLPATRRRGDRPPLPRPQDPHSPPDARRPGRTQRSAPGSGGRTRRQERNRADRPTRSSRSTSIYEDGRSEMSADRRRIRRRAETSSTRLTRERLVDESTYSLQVARVEALRRRLNESRTVMLYRIYQELTPEQYKKLQAHSRAANGTAAAADAVQQVTSVRLQQAGCPRRRLMGVDRQ